MKKFLLLSFALLLSTVVQAADGDTFTEGDFTFTVTSEEKHEVSATPSSSEISGSITIPSSVIDNKSGEKYSVTSLVNFDNCPKITSVTIPNSVTSLGQVAFAFCSSLTSITIPNSINTIEYGAFQRCNSLTTIDIPESVTTIEEWAFAHCDGLTSINFPETLVSIGEQAFCFCGKLTTINIPSSVTTIGPWAFCRCSNLTSVNIPKSVKELGECVFSACVNLTSINVEEGNENYSSLNGILFNKDLSILKVCPSANKSIFIPKSVTAIDNYAFYECKFVTSITIPNSVTSIGEQAFCGCSNISSLTLSNSIKSIGEYAFNSCRLTSIKYNSNDPINCNANIFASEVYEKASLYVPESAIEKYKEIEPWKNFSSFKVYGTSVGTFFNEGDFRYYISSEENQEVEIMMASSGQIAGDIEIPATVTNSVTGYAYTVTSICGSGFSGCNNITSITIPETVTKIGVQAFFQCRNVTSINIPESVVEIGETAFASCANLTSIIIPSSITEIHPQTFSSCTNLNSVTIPNSVITIGDRAFGGCRSLTEVSIPNSVTTIGNSAFSDCFSLYSINLPNSITEIGGYAFCNCRDLNSVTIPNSITTLGEKAFSGCNNLTSVYYQTTDPITANYNVFDSVVYENATLYVQEVAIDKCKEFDPWKNFTSIKSDGLSDIEAIVSEVDFDLPYEVYTTSGIKIANSMDNLAPGIYLIRQGNQVKKISVR